MSKIIYPQSHIFWNIQHTISKNLMQNMQTEVLVIGGGVAGLSAAQNFRQKGYTVALIEKYMCGAGASGKSSGFITTDSELGLPFFVKQFGPDTAKKIWDFGTSGMQRIKNNIEKFNIKCDFQPQDVLVVASSLKDFKQMQEEHAIYEQVSTASLLYTQETLRNVLGSESYFGGICFPGTFGINCFDYCQAMKRILEQQGVHVFEDTPALTINGHQVTTPYATITAEHIIVCVDRFLPELNRLSDNVFAAQTFLLVSEPLPPEDIVKLFPERRFMLWDTELIYNYFRLVDTNRFLIGGSDLIAIFWNKEQYNQQRIYKKLSNYVKKKFPYLSVNFEYMWPGLIGISKDVIPIAGQDSVNPNIYYITCATGLPWAAALGWYSAERIAHKNREFDEFFSYKRQFPLGPLFQKLFGKRITFALSNFINLYLRE